ncbi:MAG: HlyD family secretion protein [Caulobacteraceae bacterium]
MIPALRIAAVAGVAALLGVLVWRGFVQARPEDADVLSGYVEGEALYLAPPVSGSVTSLAVVRGQRVEGKAPLFTVDARSPSAQRDQAAARLEEVRAQAKVAAAQAEQQDSALAQARAQAANAERDAQRYARVDAAAVSQQEADRARTAAETTAAQLRAAGQTARAARAQQAAAEAAVGQARGALAETEARLDQLSVRAPAAGRIEEVYFQQGEWAGANQPILSLIPDGKVKLKFYVPERDLQAYAIGRRVAFGCDGCRQGLMATIAYLSPRPEYTPPVIYSRKSRDKLVFLVEARPDDGRGLTPGLPVDVAPLPAGARP